MSLENKFQNLSIKFFPAELSLYAIINQDEIGDISHLIETFKRIAKQKFESDINNGKLTSVNIYSKKNKTALTSIKNNSKLSGKLISILIAEGVQPLQGVRIIHENSSPANIKINLSIDSEFFENEKTNVRIFYNYLNYLLYKQGLKSKCDFPYCQQVYSILNENPNRRVFRLRSSFTRNINTMIDIQYDEAAAGLILTISGTNDYSYREFILICLKKIQQHAVAVAKSKNLKFVADFRELRDNILHIYRGVERYFLATPDSFLVCRAKKSRSKSNSSLKPWDISPEHSPIQAVPKPSIAPQAQHSASAESTNLPDKDTPSSTGERDILLDDFITWKVNSDKLILKIDMQNSPELKRKYTSKEEFSESFKESCKRNRFYLSPDEEAIEDIYRKLLANKDIKEIQIMTGHEPIDPDGPYIRLLDISEINSEKPLDESINIRDRQQTSYIAKGTKFAMIDFKDGGECGKNVYNEDIHPKYPTMEFGTGMNVDVEKDKYGRVFFIAKIDGTPTIDENNIDLTETLVVNSNVNLSSGNIIFGGTVIINGSVEEGSTVEAGDDLTINGIAQASNIKCGGNLEIKDGIIGKAEYEIHAKGDLTTRFIENAKVKCHGSIHVAKSITASKIFCKKDIEVNVGNGKINGGEYYVGERITTFDLGNDRGTITKVQIGQKWTDIIKIHINKSRKNNLEKAIERYASEIKFLKDSTTEGKKKEKKEKIQAIQDKMKKARELMIASDKKLKKIQKEAELYEGALIKVLGSLSSNTDIIVGDSKVEVSSSLKNVYIDTNERNGSFIHSTEKVDDKKEAKSA